MWFLRYIDAWQITTSIYLFTVEHLAGIKLLLKLFFSIPYPQSLYKIIAITRICDSLFFFAGTEFVILILFYLVLPLHLCVTGCHEGPSNCGRWFYLWSRGYKGMAGQWSSDITHDKPRATPPWSFAEPCSPFCNSRMAARKWRLIHLPYQET